MNIFQKIVSSVALAVIFFSCKEQFPIGLDLNTPQGDDSVYSISPTPAAQEKHVLMEEFTGTTCANCPKGAALANTLKGIHGERLLIAKLYSYFLCEKVFATDPEMKNTQAQEIAASFQEPNKPTACIDRVFNVADNLYYNSTSDWATLINIQVAKTTPINIDIIESIYNATENKVDLEVNFVATQSIAGKLNYSIYVLEDGILAGQDSAGVKIPNYVHNEVMQQSITPTVIGTPFPDKFTTAIAGSAMRKKLSFDLADRIINPSNCKILVFVHRNEGANKDVLHAVEKHLD